MGRRSKLRIEKICENCHKSYIPEKFRVGPKVIAKRRFCSKSCSAFSRKEIYRELCRKLGNTPMTKETKKKISIAGKGRPSAMGMLGKHQSAEAKMKNSIASKKQWKKLSYRKSVLGKRGLSSLEIKVQQIINKYNLPYKFVGDGKFYIEKKCPDFINTNGKKIAVEVFARKHKDLFRGGTDIWKKERLEIFKSYGWDIIFIEDWQTNSEENLTNLLKGGKYY